MNDMTEKLTGLSVSAFADTMGSDAPAPGGGSASALAEGLGAALVMMVCALTEGKEKYRDCEAKAKEIRLEAEQLKQSLIEAVDTDTQAFDIVSAAYKMPKETEAEKAARSEAIQKGLAVCIESPLGMMRRGLKVLQLAEKLAGGFNTSCASDLGVAVLMTRAGIEGAWMNVRINLGSLKDKERAAAFEAEAREILEEAIPKAEALCGKIGQML